MKLVLLLTNRRSPEQPPRPSPLRTTFVPRLLPHIRLRLTHRVKVTGTQLTNFVNTLKVWDERKWGGDRYFQPYFAAPLRPMESQL